MIKLEDYKKRIDQTLETLIPSSSHFFSSLYEGGRYALLGPGKRIRPILTLCAAEMLQEGSIEAALVPACALEMVHTYSLIHDDLPCMDNDDFRRGRPTLHRVYTEGHAVLVGDYLLTYAFELIATAPLLKPHQQVDLARVLASAAGGEGMIGGQVMDIERSEEIDHMHTRKTAALFKAAVEFSGIISHASPKFKTLLCTFGVQFGKLFQMVDDLLDKDHPLGVEKAENSAKTYFQSCLDTLKEFKGNTAPLQLLTETVFNYSK